MDHFSKSNQSLDVTQTTSETSPSEMVPGLNEEISNQAVGESGVAAFGKQHTDTGVREQEVLTANQKRNRRRKLRRWLQKAAVKNPDSGTSTEQAEGNNQLGSYVSSTSPSILADTKRPTVDLKPRSFAHADQVVKELFPLAAVENPDSGTEKAEGSNQPESYVSSPSPSNLAEAKRPRMDLEPRSLAHTVRVVKESFPLATVAGADKAGGSSQPRSYVSSPFPNNLAETKRPRTNFEPRSFAHTVRVVTGSYPLATVEKPDACTEKAEGYNRPESYVSFPSPSNLADTKRLRADFKPRSFAHTVRVVKESFPMATVAGADKAGGINRPGSFVSSPSLSSLAGTKRPRTDLEPRSFVHTVRVIKESFPLASVEKSDAGTEKAEGYNRSESYVSFPSNSNLPGTKRLRADLKTRSFAHTAQVVEESFPLAAIEKPNSDTEKAEGNNRLGSYVSSPSPSNLAGTMRPRADLQPRSFAHAAEVVKIAIVKESFPLAKISFDEVNVIQLEILNKIDMIPLGDQLPKINSSSLIAGAFILQCEDSMTVEWVKSTFHGNGLVLDSPEVLKVLNETVLNELPKPVKVAFKTRDVYTKDPSVLLRRINRLNPELKSEGWHVLQRVVEPYSIRWIFLVHLESADAIRKANYGAYTGLDLGIFKILKDPNKMPSEKAEEERETVNLVEEETDKGEGSPIEVPPPFLQVSYN